MLLKKSNICSYNNGTVKIIIINNDPIPKIHTARMANHLGLPASISFLTKGYITYARANARRNGAIILNILTTIPIHNPLIRYNRHTMAIIISKFNSLKFNLSFIIPHSLVNYITILLF